MPFKHGVASLVGMLLLVGALAAQAQPVAGLQSPWNVVGSGGSIGSSAANVQISSTVGQPAIGGMSNAAGRLHLGFWYPLPTGTSHVDDKATPGSATAFELKQNYPNPFKSQTTVAFYVPRRSRVRLKVYDMRGGLVKVLADEVFEAGNREMVWDGTTALNEPTGSGDYICQMEATALDGATTGNGGFFRQQQIMHLVK